MHESTCLHCGVRVVRINHYTLDEAWIHQPEGHSFQDGRYYYCRLTQAEPVLE